MYIFFKLLFTKWQISINQFTILCLASGRLQLISFLLVLAICQFGAYKAVNCNLCMFNLVITKRNISIDVFSIWCLPSGRLQLIYFQFINCFWRNFRSLLLPNLNQHSARIPNNTSADVVHGLSTCRIVDKICGNLGSSGPLADLHRPNRNEEEEAESLEEHVLNNKMVTG